MSLSLAFLIVLGSLGVNAQANYNQTKITKAELAEQKKKTENLKSELETANYKNFELAKSKADLSKKLNQSNDKLSSVSRENDRLKKQISLSPKGEGHYYTKTLYMNASAYTASCYGCSGKTATGLDLKANPNLKVIAVDPNIIPIGTKVHVDGYGDAIAADTGGAIHGDKIDIFIPTESDAIRWGRRTVAVQILQ